MAITLLGAVAVAVLAACVAFIFRRVTGISARWIIPASAGAAMLAFTLWNDYSWFGRVADGLPADVTVARTFESSNALQPWSLVAPITTRFQAVNVGGRQRSEVAPRVVRAEVYLVARWQPTFTTLQIFDCARGRRADAADATGGEGLPPETAWTEVGLQDALLRAACSGV
ncbi:hypothetical protein [Rubrimonas cliftonensis]|uniref:Uncharacterized protein n=1 Tax=Rubrimonas cliftonensis TaxID=89524 RepID=A0A1H3W7G3_9RHOB|nr:hypothetical protein [Rubrimonas cliftonensis]SDZ82282.1 hypothetical protein SAMN05444370_101527 [Rubrimonas cliftonensis]